MWSFWIIRINTHYFCTKICRNHNIRRWNCTSCWFDSQLVHNNPSFLINFTCGFFTNHDQQLMREQFVTSKSHLLYDATNVCQFILRASNNKLLVLFNQCVFVLTQDNTELGWSPSRHYLLSFHEPGAPRGRGTRTPQQNRNRTFFTSVLHSNGLNNRNHWGAINIYCFMVRW